MYCGNYHIHMHVKNNVYVYIVWMYSDLKEKHAELKHKVLSFEYYHGHKFKDP